MYQDDQHPSVMEIISRSGRTHSCPFHQVFLFIFTMVRVMFAPSGHTTICISDSEGIETIDMTLMLQLRLPQPRVLVVDRCRFRLPPSRLSVRFVLHCCGPLPRSQIKQISRGSGGSPQLLSFLTEQRLRQGQRWRRWHHHRSLLMNRACYPSHRTLLRTTVSLQQPSLLSSVPAAYALM